MEGASAVIVWVLLSAGLLLLEGLTTQFVGIWFAVGAAIAVVPAALGAPLWFQLVVFLVCSLLFLYFIRPIVRDKISVKKQPTNADMVIGQRGVALETVDNRGSAGRVRAMGLTWSARSSVPDLVIPKDSDIIVERIEGAKLIVSPAEVTAEIK
ncbi:MAG: NfeD family protein [Oscillospiraceae bacterium]|nr:NfeD family protein [Oscillospiraceae bacterium]